MEQNAQAQKEQKAKWYDRHQVLTGVSITVLGVLAFSLFIHFNHGSTAPQSTSINKENTAVATDTPTQKTSFITGCMKSNILHGNEYCNCAWNFITANPSKNWLKAASNSPEMKQIAVEINDVCRQYNIKPLTLEEKIIKALPDSISNPDVSVDNAIDFITYIDVPGKKDVTITANHNGTYWDTNGTKEATWNEAIIIMQRVFPLDDSINGIIIINQVPVTDAYGKNTTDMLTTISLSRDTYNKIDFKNFDYKNIPVIADKYIENHNIK